MRVLLLNQFFYPDRAPTGELLGDVARRLSRDGCEVVVVCGRNQSKEPASEMKDVRVVRTPVFAFKHSAGARLLSYASFLAAAFWHAVRQKPDVIVTLTTPPFLSLAGTMAKRFRGTRHFIWEMDVYPDVAVAVGVLGSTTLLARGLERLARFARRRADGVIALGDCMRELLVLKGAPAAKVHIVENWADGALISPGKRPSDGPLHVLYSGNLGMAHDEDTICGVMEALRHQDRFHFTFAGGGSRRRKVEEFCRSRGIANVTFRSYCSRDRLGAELAKADIGLVTQRPECLGSTVPSKVYTLMAAARPFLFIGPRKSTPSRIAERHGCGWRADCGDVPAIVDLLTSLADSPELMATAGRRAREIFLREYDLPIATARISAILGASVERPKTAAQASGV